VITIHFKSIDGYRGRRSFKALAAAKKYAVKLVGENPEIGSFYAVAGDGVVRITADGARIADLFPQPEAAPRARHCTCEVSQVYGGDCIHTLAGEEARLEKDAATCFCSEVQLKNVGCNCDAQPKPAFNDDDVPF